MIVNRKIWLGLTLMASGGIATTAFAGMQAGEGGEGGEAGATAAKAQGGEAGEAGEGGEKGSFPGGNFDRALALLMAGEGGEGGIGTIKGKRTVSVPALDDAQIRKVVSGNTLRTEYHLAYHLDPSGSAEGWEMLWEKVDPSKCAPGKLQNGECWMSRTVKLPASKWAARDDKLCISPRLSAVTGPGDCAEVYMVLNKVVLFGSDDKLVGKGSDLYKGRKLEEKVAH